MQKIPLKLAVPGMVLARDVFRNDSPIGMPICGRETVLTDALIARLDHLDVQTIQVEGHPVWSEGDHSLEDLLADLDHRFEKVRSDPLTGLLYDIYVRHLKRSMGEDGGK